MYRYSSQSRFNSVMRSRRWQPLVWIVLVLLIGVLLFKFVGMGGMNEDNYEKQRNAKLRSEVQHAMSQVNQLSRLGGSSTSNILGRIRQYVHGVEALNDLNVSMLGEIGRMYVQSDFDDIYSIIDAYDAKLQSGQKVSDSLTLLTEAVTSLSDKTYGLVGQ